MPNPTFGGMGDGMESNTDLPIIQRNMVNQDQLINHLTIPIIRDLVNRSFQQEDTLKSLYRPVVNDVADRIKDQDELLSPFAESIRSDIRGRIAQQAEMLSRLLPPAQRSDATENYGVYFHCPSMSVAVLDKSDIQVIQNYLNTGWVEYATIPNQPYAVYEAIAQQLQGQLPELCKTIVPTIPDANGKTGCDRFDPRIAYRSAGLSHPYADPGPPDPNCYHAMVVFGGCRPPGLTAETEWREGTGPPDAQQSSGIPVFMSYLGWYWILNGSDPHNTLTDAEWLKEVKRRCRPFGGNGSTLPPPIVVPPIGPFPPDDTTPPPTNYPPFCPADKPDPCQSEIDDATDKPIDVSQIPEIPIICDFDFGSPQFCQTIGAALDGFKALGDWAIDVAETAVTGLANTRIGIYQQIYKVPYAGKILAQIWEYIPIKTISDAFKVARKMMGNRVAGKENVLFGLYFVKALVRAAESINFGWDLGPEITAIISVQFPQIVQVLDYLISYICPITAPGPPAAVGLYLHNLITREHYDCISKANGIPSSWSHLMPIVQRSRPTDDLFIRHYMRFRRPLPSLHDELRAIGWVNPEERTKAIQMLEYLPPPSDLIHFAVRDTFDPEKIGKPEMLEEYRKQIGLREFFHAQGIGPIQIKDAKGKTWTEDMGEHYWLAHYHQISPTQAFEMVNRLRPGRTEKWAFTDSNGLKRVPDAVLIDDVLRMLKEEDYNPYWRLKLAAINYRSISRVDIRRFYRLGVFGNQRYRAGFVGVGTPNPRAVGQAEIEVYESYRDLRFSESDAHRQALFTAIEAERQLQGKSDARHKNLLCQAYQNGVLSADNAIEELTPILRDRKEAERHIRLCDVERKLKDIKTGISSIRKIFLKGLYDENEAKVALSQIGVARGRDTELVNLWKLQMVGLEKEANATIMCQWLREGTITRSEMVLRLSRMHYTPIDIARILRHCDLGTLALSAKEREKRARAEQAMQKERERIAQIAERNRQEATEKAIKDRERMESKRLSAYTDVNIRKWYSLGILEAREIVDVLEARGWDQRAIDNYMEALEPPKE